MSDTTAAATLQENDRQAGVRERYIARQHYVLSVLGSCARLLRSGGYEVYPPMIDALLAEIEGEPAPHDVDECEDRECAVCSEYHAGRDDGGSCQDEDSRFAPLIDPEKERAKLAQRTQP